MLLTLWLTNDNCDQLEWLFLPRQWSAKYGWLIDCHMALMQCSTFIVAWQDAGQTLKMLETNVKLLETKLLETNLIEYCRNHKTRSLICHKNESRAYRASAFILACSARQKHLKAPIHGLCIADKLVLKVWDSWLASISGLLPMKLNPLDKKRLKWTDTGWQDVLLATIVHIVLVTSRLITQIGLTNTANIQTSSWQNLSMSFIFCSQRLFLQRPKLICLLDLPWRPKDMRGALLTQLVRDISSPNHPPW